MRASSAARRSGVAKLPPSISRDQSMSASGRARRRSLPRSRRGRRSARDRRGPALPAAARSAGSCRACRCGSARSAARYAAFCPALSPSKHRTGSSAIFHSSASWFSVSAVPSGATRAGKARADHRDDIDIAFDHDQRRAVMRGLPRGRRGCRDCRPCETAAFPASSDISPATSFSSARPPKAMTRPRTSVIGNITRSRKRSYGTGMSSPPISSPASTMSSTGMPCAPRCSFSAKRSAGA